MHSIDEVQNGTTALGSLPRRKRRVWTVLACFALFHLSGRSQDFVF
jgi:hypothetical protein